MSNKSDLQALNANYAALIETLKGKATGGSGGGSIETCTVGVTVKGGYGIAYNTVDEDGNLILKTFCSPLNNYEFSFTVVKGTILYAGAFQLVSTTYTVSKSGEISYVNSSNSSQGRANELGVGFLVEGDGTISVT